MEVVGDTEQSIDDNEIVISSEDEEDDVNVENPEDALEVDLAEADDEENQDEAESGENVDSNAQRADQTTSTKSRASTCPLDLPISVVRRIMKSAAPHRRFTPEFIAAFARSAGAFALYLLSASQDASVDAGRSTIRPVEVINGLIACGFPELAEETRISMGLGLITNKKIKRRR